MVIRFSAKLNKLKIGDQLKEDLKNYITEETLHSIQEFIRHSDEVIVKLTRMLQTLVYTIRMEAKQSNVIIEDDFVCCGDPDCTTCFGRYLLHYPYLYIRTMQPVYESLTNVKAKTKRKLIHQRDLRQFLPTIGISEDRIEYLFYLIDLRTEHLKFRNGVVKLWTKMGCFEDEHSGESEKSG